MIGLEKVTGKIIADAEADARSILAKAEEDCKTRRAEVQSATDAEKDRIRQNAERECEAVVVRAKSSAVMAKRNVLLETRAEMVDEAYRRAAKEVRDMPADKYFELLTMMLKGALSRQLEGERDSMRLYGEDISPERYEILLNTRDKKNYGEQLLAAARSTLCGKVGITDPARVVLASDTADINGGLVLRCGDVEANCSLTMLFAEVRRTTEQAVSEALFGGQA
ncbi:MAG: V-type ATP synthase subunit E [Clostridia bacterium]|nr:V-type ATP synthase subunit E [Clostridia bacterium]